MSDRCFINPNDMQVVMDRQCSLPTNAATI
jgi:hypothetical protein